MDFISAHCWNKLTFLLFPANKSSSSKIDSAGCGFLLKLILNGACFSYFNERVENYEVMLRTIHSKNLSHSSKKITMY